MGLTHQITRTKVLPSYRPPVFVQPRLETEEEGTPMAQASKQAICQSTTAVLRRQSARAPHNAGCIRGFDLPRSPVQQ